MAGKGLIRSKVATKFIFNKVATHQPVTLTHNDCFQGFFIDFKNTYFLGDLLIAKSKSVLFQTKIKERV